MEIQSNHICGNKEGNGSEYTNRKNKRRKAKDKSRLKMYVCELHDNVP